MNIAFVRSTTLLSVLAVAIGGCLPERDNGNDPTNRPAAALSVYVQGTGGNEGTRSDVFVLDASASVDPRARPLSFSWDLDGDGDAELASVAACAGTDPSLPCAAACGDPAVPGACLQTRLTLTTAQLPSGVGAATRAVGVLVRAGNSATPAMASAVVRNAAPVLDLGDDLFVPELTGGVVRLDACAGRPGTCATPDPDGDPVTWTWRQLRGTPPVTLSDPASAAPTFTAPLEEQTLLFEVEVDDGLSSVTRRLPVHVTTQAWVTTFEPTLVYRVFSDFRVVHTTAVGGAEEEAPEGGVAAGGDGAVWIGVGTHATNGNLVRGRVERRTQNAGGWEVDSQWSLDGAFVPTSIAPLGDAGCAAFRTHTDEVGTSFDPPSLFAWLASGGVRVDSSDSADLGEEPAFVFPAPGGQECWAVTKRLPGTNGGASIYRLGSSGALVTVAADRFVDVTAAAVEPDGSLWVAGVAAECPVTSVVRVTGAGAVSGVACLPNRVDAAAAEPGAVWLHDEATLEIVRVRADGGVEISDAPPLSLPRDGFFPRGEPVIAFDAIARELWVVEGYQGLFARLRETSPSRFDVAIVSSIEVRYDASAGIPRFAAVTTDEGRAWALMRQQAGPGGALVSAPSHMRVVEQLYVSAPDVSVSPDPTRGDVWLTDGGGSGQSLRKRSLEGTALVSVSLGEALHVDATSDGGAWVAIRTTAGTGAIARVDRNGVELRRVPLAFPAVRVDVLESANGDERVCAVTWNEPDDSDLVHYDPVNDQLSTAPGAFGARPSGARAWSGGCWFSFQSDPGEVLHYDGSTVEPVDAPGTGEVISLDVDRDGNAWFAAVHTPGAYQALMAPPGGTATLVLDTEFEPVLQVEVQERCAASCAPGAARDLWIARGGSILRLDGDYRVMQVYELSIAPTITSLVVLP